jgi:diaminopimelate decarboxylase
MHHFAYRGGLLHAEEVSITDIAAAVGTPFYCYSTATLERHYRVFAEAFTGTDARICYAMKANSNQSVLMTLAALGAGMDVVSGGELARALAAGVGGERIVFSGVGKTDAEIAAALDARVFSINVESEAELVAIARIAQEKGVAAPISLRINPDVDARTHAKITTGMAENKFGIAFAEAPRLYRRAAELDGIEATGVATHIGSQITGLAPFRAAFQRMAELVDRLRRDGHRIAHVDLGGGLGIPYRADDRPPHPRDYAELVLSVLGGIGATLVLEPGRLIAGNAGILVTRVVHTKHGRAGSFLIVDAAMNDLIRPTLYEAHHEILPVREQTSSAGRRYDVVGPVCETGDYLARDRELPDLASGDLVALMTAGAYGAVQSGTYNSRPLIAEVLVRAHEYAVVRPRQAIDELIGLDRIAPWLDSVDARRSRLATL